jgi:synaptotagmin-1
VLQAQQLPAMDMGGSSDPYVKVRLLPAMKPIFETDVQHKSLYPVFNETFVFQVPYSELASRTVAFYIFDYDRFSKDELIGNVFFRLAEYDAHKVLLEWRDIQKPSLADEITYGDLCLSLRYVPASGHLTVVVLEAKSLPVLETGDNPDTYVKLSLIRNGKRVQKKKTSVKKSTINPYFNESFVFDVPYEHIQNMKLLATVAVPGWLGKSKRIGSIELGSEVEIGSAMRHWSDMLSNPRRPIASWHQLQGLSPS